VRHCFASSPRRAAACALAVLVARPVGAQAATPRYTSGWGDIALVAGGAALAAAGAITRPPAASCAPCDPADLPGLDRGVLDWNGAAARGASHVLAIGVVGGASLAAVAGQPTARARGDAAVLATAVAWSAAAAQWLKVGVHRARPALYRSGAPAAAADPANRESFPSGHASVAFAAATAYTTLALRQRLPHTGRNALLLYAAAVGVAATRVAGGRHFPTDVLGGAALGAAIGWGTARLHPMTP
jgi:membrane-associated phospholipid phosphatase